MSTITATPFRLKDGKMMVLRSATPADAPQILEHVHAILAEGEFVLSTLEDFHMTEEQEALWLQTNLDEPCKVVIVAENESQLIGLLNFHNGERKRISHQGELSMSVNRAWRSQGIGRALLSALILWAQQEPVIEKVCLEVFATNTRAISLYQALAFQEEGRLVKQIKLGPGMYVDTIRMGRFVK
ncbi:MAG: GNAT family N-acetyltransferase [Chloroflexota bacterium]|nr:GNAT family N-acetyltransferase [Chloroflexota bacterium]